MNAFFGNSYSKKAILLLCGLLILFIPFDLTIAEHRGFQIVNRNGVAIKDAKVRQYWHQYSLGYSSGDDLISDINGFVFLPARTIRTTIFDVLYGTITTIFEYKLHASIGSSDSIFVHAENHEGRWYYDGKGLESKIVVLN